LQLYEKDGVERVKELEQETRRLQKQVNVLQQNYESQLAQLRQPAVNAPIYDILPRGSIARAGGRSEMNRIKVPPTTRNFVVILYRDSGQDYPDYALEIVDQKGQVRWRGEGLKPNRDGNFVMTLDRTFLGEGRYHLKLYGQASGRSRMIAEYIIVVE
jgi:hypothetical protein